MNVSASAIGNNRNTTTGIEEVWRQFRPRVIGLARSLLRSNPSPMFDEEDIAQIVFHAYFRNLTEGRYPQLIATTGIWAVLARITHHRVIDHLRYENRLRRRDHVWLGDCYSVVESAAHTPEATAIAKETFERMMESLDDDQLKEVAVGKIRGLTNVELADKLGCSTRTIERRLVQIRDRLAADRNSM